MQTASCVVCQERVNLLTQKLVTVQWVDGRSGALLSLTFHSDCYARWYGENARSVPKNLTDASQKDAPLATVAPPSPSKTPPATPAEAPDRHLSPEEMERLQPLRGRRDTDAAPRPPADSAESGGGPEVQERDHQHDHAPDDQQPKDSHDVAPPDV